ncbi:MAG: Mannan endo,4-beta-mannosidase Cellulase [Marmoricola sp.]|nr:Mannan endo,4-beta-mannosidase Cellulase [Marmoricola sp.]
MAHPPATSRRTRPSHPLLGRRARPARSAALGVLTTAILLGAGLPAASAYVDPAARHTSPLRALPVDLGGTGSSLLPLLPTTPPTGLPTDLPSTLPTGLPTDLPTILPIGLPTDVPSDLPTNQPTNQPTDQPTSLPTNLLTDLPTLPTLPAGPTTDVPVPTGLPLPSGAPSGVPTGLPLPGQEPTPSATSTPLHVVLSPLPEVVVPAGVDVVLTATAAGDPTPTQQWQERASVSSPWEDLPGADAATLTLHAPTLAIDGHQYRAVFTSAGDQVETSPATVHVLGTAPSAPQHLLARQTGVGEVTLTWDDPSTAGSSPVTSFEPGWSTGQSGGGTSVPGGRHSAVFSGLGTGRYSFSVDAVNAAGPGERAATSPALVVGAAPSLVASAGRLVAGQRLTLSGLARPGSRVTLERALAGASYRRLAAVTAGPTGAYAVRVSPTATATYRARMGGAAPSDAATVPVASRVSTAATRTGTRTYRLHGTVFPAVARQLVTVRSRTTGAYSTLGTARTDRRGRWSLRHRFPTRATYAIQATAAATRATTAGTGSRNLGVR